MAQNGPCSNTREKHMKNQQFQRQAAEGRKALPVAYDRTLVRPGIVHIGVGNFHRAHEAFYTNALLADESQSGWGICGVSLLPGDEAVDRALRSQDGMYTLTVCGRDGKNETYVVGSLVELIWAPENVEAALCRIASPHIGIVTMTITEGGYNLDRATGEFDFDQPGIQHDLNDPERPVTVFGVLAAGLRRRRDMCDKPLTILSCDNLQHNGDTARRALTAFVERQDPSLASWMEHNVSFPNSMVDRITPRVTEDDRKRLNAASGIEDAAPVFCEDFIQWVIEDDFRAGRPAWENVGVTFTDDVSAYEKMKLSLLNASHSMLAYPAFLAGYRQVVDAMNDERFVRYLREFMNEDMTPLVPAPEGVDLELYKKTLLERFANRAVGDQLARLCLDGASKLPVYIMPRLAEMIDNGAELKRVAFLLAAYRRYLSERTDELGHAYEIEEPYLTESDLAILEREDPLEFLKLSPFAGVDLLASASFVAEYLRQVQAIREWGVLGSLERVLDGNDDARHPLESAPSTRATGETV